MLNISILKVQNENDRKIVINFLKSFDLSLDLDVEYTCIAKIDGSIAGTCSFSGMVIKCFAVRDDLQGYGIAASLLTHITNVLYDLGVYETFIFTKKKNSEQFRGLGFMEVYSTKDVQLLEGGMANVNLYIENMFKNCNLSNNKKAGLVMNCNPFTLGHRYLIEAAAALNNEVVVFIVEENKSVFPFDVRLELVKKGIADLKNVHVIPGGQYIISSKTFPSYFLKEKDEHLLSYTRIDAGIFGKYISKAFNINKRYIGTEPYCLVTAEYNNALFDEMGKYNIETVCLERFKINNEAVSASIVRKLILNNNFQKIKSLVPESTYSYLVSDAAKDIIKKIQSLNGD